MRFSILLLIVITVLSLMPGQEFPETDVSFADKWVHWFMYGTWTVVVLWEARKRKTAHRVDQKPPDAPSERPHDNVLSYSHSIVAGGLGVMS